MSEYAICHYCLQKMGVVKELEAENQRLREAATILLKAFPECPEKRELAMLIEQEAGNTETNFTP